MFFAAAAPVLDWLGAQPLSLAFVFGATMWGLIGIGLPISQDRTNWWVQCLAALTFVAAVVVVPRFVTGRSLIAAFVCVTLLDAYGAWGVEGQATGFRNSRAGDYGNLRGVVVPIRIYCDV